MNIKEGIKSFWHFLQQDTWQSWVVSIILIIIIIKFIFFPTLSLITNTSLPLVVVESCSMYHSSSFDLWWNSNGDWYEEHNITKSKLLSSPFKNGLNKGDIIIVWGRASYNTGDIIIFSSSQTRYPVIHRLISTNPLGTKGDNGKTNSDQLTFEKNINKQQVMGKAVARIPLIGWVKLIFFEPFKDSQRKGLCS